MNGSIINTRYNPYKSSSNDTDNSITDFAVTWKYDKVTSFSDYENYTCTRIGDSKDFNFYIGTDTFPGQSDFDKYMPWKGIRVCALDETGNVVSYSGDPEFTYENSEYDIMVEIPKFWYGIEVNQEDKIITFHISSIEKEGYYVSPRHQKFSSMTKDFDKIYVSAYPCYTGGKSISGVMIAKMNPSPYNILERYVQEQRGSVTGFYQMDFLTCLTIELLRIVETANVKFTNVIPSYDTLSRYVTGSSNAAYHTVTTGIPKYRNFELLNYMQCYVQGIHLKSGKVYVSLDPVICEGDNYENSEYIMNYPFHNNQDGYRVTDVRGYYMTGITISHPESQYQDWTVLYPYEFTHSNSFKEPTMIPYYWPYDNPYNNASNITNTDSGFTISRELLGLQIGKSTGDKIHRLIYLPPET